MKAITVSAINTYVRSILESDEALADISIEGEISNFSKNYKTGHCYFSIKDAKSSIRAVMFRGHAERLAFAPQDGMKVIARGFVTLYERDGTYQLGVEFLFPHGQGAVQQAVEQLRAQLESEGLFAPESKIPLPKWPSRIGLITSKTGAALQDILNIAERRCPITCFLLFPVNVQGIAAAQQIATAISYLDNSELAPDVIIVARGGGSAEDLSVFNSEAVARAAYLCKTPIVSAVGHETDTTIFDFVADMRAPTPSAAAELVLPDLHIVYANMLHQYTNFVNNMQFRIHSWYNDLHKMAIAIGNLGPAKIINNSATLLDLKPHLLHTSMHNKLALVEQRLMQSVNLAENINPLKVLARGYAIAKGENGELRSIHQIAKNQHIEVLLSDGTLGCHVDEIIERQDSLNG